jgi:hypothetical protein
MIDRRLFAIRNRYDASASGEKLTLLKQLEGKSQGPTTAWHIANWPAWNGGSTAWRAPSSRNSPTPA